MALGTEQKDGLPIEQKVSLAAPELIDALKNLPREVYPVNLEVSLSSIDETDVIPLTTARVEWHHIGGKGMYVVETYKPLEFYTSDANQLGEIKRSLLSGKKPSTIRYLSGGYGDYRSAYEKFINEELEQQVINGPYQINGAMLTITTYHMSGYSQGDYADTAVFIRKKRDEDNYLVELRVGREISSVNENALRNWFSTLSASTVQKG